MPNSLLGVLNFIGVTKIFEANIIVSFEDICCIILKNKLTNFGTCKLELNLSASKNIIFKIIKVLLNMNKAQI